MHILLVVDRESLSAAVQKIAKGVEKQQETCAIEARHSVGSSVTHEIHPTDANVPLKW